MDDRRIELPRRGRRGGGSATAPRWPPRAAWLDLGQQRAACRLGDRMRSGPTDSACRHRQSPGRHRVHMRVSPVIRLWSISECPRPTTPSTAMRSPGAHQHQIARLDPRRRPAGSSRACRRPRPASPSRPAARPDCGDDPACAPHALVEGSGRSAGRRAASPRCRNRRVRRVDRLDQRHRQRQHDAERDRHIHVELRARSAFRPSGRTGGRHRRRRQAISADSQWKKSRARA
jgi:hypothetical protein